MTARRYAFLFIGLAWLGAWGPVALAQQTLTGKVLDAQTETPLVGVHILVERATAGTVTDASGQFTLQSDRPLGTLTFSYVGYKAQTVTVTDEATPLEIRMEPTRIDLQPVVVSESRISQPRTEVPAAIATLSASQIQESRPSMLYELLNTVPGVHMVNLGNEQYKMSIRQPFTNRAYFLYLEDGLPLRPTGIFNPNALIEMNMAGVDRIEVIRGPASAMYGSNAVAGAINFITPTPSPVLTGRLDLRASQYGYRRSDFEASTTTGKLGLYAGGYLARQRNGWFEHSDFDKVSLTARADYALAPATTLTTTLSANRLDTDTNGALDSLNFFDRGVTSLHTFTYRKVDALRLRSTLAHVWNSQHKTQVTGYLRDNSVKQLPYYRIRNDRRNAKKATGEINDQAFRSLGALVQHEAHFEPLGARLVGGLSLDRSPSSYLARFISVDRDETGRYIGYTDPDSMLTDYDVDMTNAATFGRLELNPLGRLKVITSLRYDWIHYDYDNNLSPSAFSGAPDEKNGFSRVSPKVGVTYDLGGGRGLYANYSLGFVPPEVGELYNGVKVPTLKPSVFDSYEAGGWSVWLQGKLYLDASIYHMEGTNEIITIILEDGARENRNAGHTRHQGIEYAVHYLPLPSLSFRLSSTHARHKFIEYIENGNAYSGNEMAGSPNWVANAEITYRPTFLKGLRGSLEWQHVGPYELDETNTAQYGGYDILHARVGYQIRGVELWLNLENLTDETYATTAAAYVWGTIYNPGTVRTLTAGIGYRFN